MKLPSSALLLALTSLTLCAQTVNFQLEGFSDGSYGSFAGTTPPYIGAGAAPDTGVFWNQIAYNAASSLTDLNSDGLTSSTIQLTLSNANDSFNSSGSGVPTTEADLLMGWRKGTGGSDGTTGNLVISGLSAGSDYTLYFYGVNGAYTGHGGDFTIGSTSHSTTGNQGVTFALGSNYVVFSNVVADSSGTIAGSWTSAAGDGYFPEGDLNAIQIVATPEPRTWEMLAVTGMVMLGLWVRRLWCA